VTPPTVGYLSLVPRMPSRVSLLAHAAATTLVVVALGVAFHPVDPAPDARLAGAYQAEPRGVEGPPVGTDGDGGGAAAGRGRDAVPPRVVARQVTIERMSREQLLRIARKKAEAEARAQMVATSAELTISSFNVLGSSHTAGGGKNARMASGASRIRNAATLLNIHGVDVVGFQELQGDQYRSFLGVAGGAFDVYPGLAAGPLGVENSIAWRTSEWTLKDAGTVQIPYFDGRLRPMPYVLLEHNATGRMAWFANFHNPATNSKRGNNDRHRAAATAREIALVNELHGSSGYPVFVTGDMNDRTVYFCRMTGGAPMVAANGGSNDGGCAPPSRMPVDWIFGHEMVTFSNYVRDEGPLVRRTTDHPMIVATATLDEQDGIPAG
jgi:hypothetical protein